MVLVYAMGPNKNTRDNREKFYHTIAIIFLRGMLWFPMNQVFDFINTLWNTVTAVTNVSNE
jgi:hypothetical protein